ncbi:MULTISPECIES: hypothetical protein [Bacillus]|mgnify:CR=1 FL=1|uniref:Uncharacterized protein n=1 Tax=Bacillus glycinifermentans TaxID=1664069 RepID=A0AAJ4D4F1_9BACI|nr:hypothetical protein [Bacillus glycinifermentans]MED8020277.1 hypothetical protein [Bacillus glycinifermentans]NUJ17505.1 hypothetical protein [Bacillus glycinifermentans]QAT67440.1 hypothetical protein EQZ20_22845 [Bacillus glycinifermentans]WKB77088.1 hypothetical protein QYM22_22570 [Bacillus glycinifermentans]SCA88242.1 hypothetical protein BGLY_4419 [Bacillus glycinifermentans]
MLFLDIVQCKGVVSLEKRLTASHLKEIAEHIEDTREEYNELLLQVRKLIRDIDEQTIPMEKIKESLSGTYEQMKEYALFVESIEAFLKSSARNISANQDG